MTEILCSHCKRRIRPPNELTKAEQEVLALVRKGYSNRDIAIARHTGIAAAKQHITRIRKKMGAKTRVEMILGVRK